MRRFGVSRLSPALIEDGQVVGSEGFGVSADTIFAAASLSKPPFAYLVLRLCNRGLLDLDTPLAEFYPEPSRSLNTWSDRRSSGLRTPRYSSRSD
jgi:CubicO group peptidase (beta-lactamase class C family)